MLIALSCHTVICQSVAEILSTGVAPLGAVSHRFIFFNLILIKIALNCTTECDTGSISFGEGILGYYIESVENQHCE